MKALFLLDGLQFGGSERKSVRLVNELAARGRSVHLAYLRDLTALLPQIDARVPTACLHRRGKFSLRALLNLRRFVATHQISVVLCMNLYPLLYAAALKLSLGKRSPKIVLAVNITDFNLKRDHWYMLLYGPLIRLTGAVIFGCEYQRNAWQKKYRLENVRSLVIYNGVDTEVFGPGAADRSLRDKLGVASGFLVGCIGRLDAEKNHAAVLEVAARLMRDDARVDVVLVGTGPEQERLERLGAELGIADRVHLLGTMSDVRPALAAFDVFVLPSLSVETFSNAALEAMAMGLPVVLSDIAGAPEMVTDGESGFLYAKNDLARLARVLRELRADPTLRERIGRQARETVLSRFAVTRMVTEYERVLAEA